MSAQWWLAEVDQYGAARPIDGPHSDRAGVSKACFLYDSMGLTKGRKLACMEVHVSDVSPSSDGVNMRALGACHEMGLRPDPEQPKG